MAAPDAGQFDDPLGDGGLLGPRSGLAIFSMADLR